MINTASIFQLMRPLIDGFIGKYDQLPENWKQIFQTKPSEHAFEIIQEIRYLGFARRKEEGVPMAQDTMSTRNQKTVRHNTYGLSFPISREAIKDNLYKTQFPDRLAALGASLRATRTQEAMNVLNLGNTVITTTDGVTLFNTAHPLDNGITNSNYAGVALSEVGIQQGVKDIRGFKQLSGIPASVKPQLLVVGTANETAATILTNSQYRASVGTANNNALAGVNDINAIYHNSIFPKGYVVDSYLTNENFAAIITDVKGLIHYEREKIQNMEWVDQHSHTNWFSAFERYSFDATDWRSVYGLMV
jgi:hypothetical protein